MGFFNKKDKAYIIPAKFYNDPYYAHLKEQDKEAWGEEVRLNKMKYD